ncbi:biopolymer transporter ExbD [Roseospira marina]|uniref:Biopolymer transporter ExbD n=1 Tax=Roseospira marina TaxID=140057 RepID=A0A5M6I7A8_9PROT|nr:biopolymer transporter ExbD [Roseospira marina]KAA5604086.1 biopolymer transporter ExbD [Roseospira marina]MBB4315816.1 biopolymer transport protein ExbD [Roseospira marina]MBB5088945.1 biopolymer transport protein ExbD [Roseospira marina]
MTGPAVSRPSGLEALRPAARRRPLVSLTPLIDVVFILLVFFMLATSFMDWRVIGLDTPHHTAPTTASPTKSTTLRIDVGARELRLDGQPATLEQIARTVAARLETTPDQRVLVRPAPGVPLQRAVTVLDHLAALGVSAMALSRPGGAAASGE